MCPVLVARDLTASFLFCPGMAAPAQIAVWKRVMRRKQASYRHGHKAISILLLRVMRLWSCGQPRPRHHRRERPGGLPTNPQAVPPQLARWKAMLGTVQGSGWMMLPRAS